MEVSSYKKLNGTNNTNLDISTRSNTEEFDKTNTDNNSSTNINDNLNFDIDYENDKYPYCIVWTKLPLISSFFPFIGHVGICNSKGKIYDFAGSNYIGEDVLAFSRPMKYVKFTHFGNWDQGITKSNLVYKNQDHNLLCNNCHSHVACALNYMKYNGKSNYNMIYIWWYCLVYSRYVRWIDILDVYSGWIIIGLIVFLILFLPKYI